MTIAEQVTAGVDAFGAAEAALRTAHDEMLNLPAVYAAISQEGIDPRPPGVPNFGYVEAQRRAARAKRIAGLIGGVLEAVMEAHADDTERAQALGIDLPPPAPPGTVTPMGGGR